MIIILFVALRCLIEEMDSIKVVCVCMCVESCITIVFSYSYSIKKNIVSSISLRNICDLCDILRITPVPIISEPLLYLIFLSFYVYIYFRKKQLTVSSMHIVKSEQKRKFGKI